MAEVSDYINIQFGDFRITDSISHGKEAEVFLCQHLTTGRYYILRLDVEDERLWEGEPTTPPRNAILERKNAHGTWVMSRHSYELSLEERKKDINSFVVMGTPIYGVLNNRYLVPVASPIRVRNAWDVDQVLQTSPADDLYLFELWEDLTLSMISGAYDSDIPNLAWTNTWGHLLGGSILENAMAKYLDGGDVIKRPKAPCHTKRKPEIGRRPGVSREFALTTMWLPIPWTYDFGASSGHAKMYSLPIEHHDA